MKSVNSEGTINAYNVSGYEVEDGDRYGYKIIAVVDGEFWSAYRGLTDWEDDYVARCGDRISYEVARLLFPTIDASRTYYD